MSFWTGFEKRALSPELLRRASEKAYDAAARTNAFHKMHQGRKFGVAALKKRATELSSAHRADLEQVVHMLEAEKPARKHWRLKRGLGVGVMTPVGMVAGFGLGSALGMHPAVGVGLGAVGGSYLGKELGDRIP